MPPYAINNYPASNPSTGQPVNNYNPPNSLAEGGIGYAFGTYDPLAQVAVGELPALNEASIAFALQSRHPVGGDSGRTVTFDYSFDVAPGAITVELQGAMQDVDNQYVKIADQTAIAVNGNSATETGVRFNFLRLKITALTIGQTTKMVGRILA